MNTQQLLAFVLFSFVAAITPGPSNIILATTGANVGIRRGLQCLLGVTLGMGFMIVVGGLGLGSLVLGDPVVRDGLKWTGVAFLLWLAWRTANAGFRSGETSPDVVGFWQAAGLQWVNPKSWLVTASAIAANLQPESSAFLQSLYLAVLFVLVALPSCLVWLAFGATLQRFLRSETASRRFNIAMALLIAGSVVLFVR